MEELQGGEEQGVGQPITVEAKQAQPKREKEIEHQDPRTTRTKEAGQGQFVLDVVMAACSQKL